MTDHAAEIAQYLFENTALGIETLRTEVGRRWPNAGQEEVMRGVKIAGELKRAEAAEYFAKADALEAGDTSLLTPEDTRQISANTEALRAGRAS